MSEPDGQHVGELVLYATDDRRAQFFLRAEGGTVWLTQAEIAALFQTTPQNITQHGKSISAEGEATEQATCKSHLQVQAEGARQVRRTGRSCNLDLIDQANWKGTRRMSLDTMIKIAHERYEEFDGRLRNGALAPDADDITEIEQAERHSAKQNGGRNAS